MNRRPVVLALALAAGGAVLVPAGVGAGARFRSAAGESEQARCADARALAELERQATAGLLEGAATAELFEVRLEKLVSDACKPQKDCADQKRAVAELAEVRGSALSASVEAELAAAEAAFLRKHCSS